MTKLLFVLEKLHVVDEAAETGNAKKSLRRGISIDLLLTNGEPI